MAISFGPVTAEPYQWPYDGSFTPERTALVNIDWQVDFCGVGGYVERMGYDIGLTRAGVPAAAKKRTLFPPATRVRLETEPPV